MVTVKRLVLDVLKPHHPNGLEFSAAVAGRCGPCRVRLTVAEMDEKTESVVLVVEGDDLMLETVIEVIGEIGGSIHSIDEVEVENRPAAGSS